MPDEIEFLDTAPTPGEDEQLPAPPRSGLPGSPRTRTIAAVVALVALVVGGLIVRGVTGGGSDAEPVTPSVHASPAPRPNTSASAESDGGRLTSPAEIFCGQANGASLPTDPASEDGMVTCAHVDPSTCRSVEACTPTGEIPMSVVAAVRVQFPDARFALGSTEIVRQNATLWYRYVKLLAKRNIKIQVLIEQRAVDSGFAGDLDDGTHEITRAVHRAHDLTTIVQITRPSGNSQVGAAAALARDPRLLAVG